VGVIRPDGAAGQQAVIGTRLWPTVLTGALWPIIRFRCEAGIAWRASEVAYFSPSWTAFQADYGRDFSVIVDGVSV